MTNETALLGLIADLYRDRAALPAVLAENAQLRADVQRLEAAINELRAPTET